MKILAFDCETGGLEPEDASLLSVYFQVLDDNLEPIDDLELFVKPDDGVYLINEGALRVNKIDLITHSAKAITYKEAGKQLKEFLAKHGSLREKLIPFGHNVPFDIKFVLNYLVGKAYWNKYVSYHMLDTVTAAVLFKLAKKLKSNQKLSLVPLAENFGIDSSNAHDAKADIGMTVNVLKSMVKEIE